MYINHNQMAGNVANTLTSHYSNLATSTQRLSSGLRVNSAADDAAGLAIRELMRADISALQQGVRNANDAISLIQTADGALGIIDEKLIRMKELAEQAATGTYDSTQRLMIESEYQAMASEITRIANATDFNGIKLLDGSLEGTHNGSKMDSTGELKVHFGSGNDSAEDYYYIGIGEMTAAALGVGNSSTWEDVASRAADAFEKKLVEEINNPDRDLTDAERGQLLSQVSTAVDNYKNALIDATKGGDISKSYKLWASADGPLATNDDGFLADGKQQLAGNSTLLNDFLAAGALQDAVAGGGVNAAPTRTVDGTDAEVQAKLNQIKAAIQSTVSEVGAKTFGATIDNTITDTTATPGATDAVVSGDAEKLAKAIVNAAKDAGITTDLDDLYEALHTADGQGVIDAGLTGVDPSTAGNWKTAVDTVVDSLFQATAGTDPADTTLQYAVVNDIETKAKTAVSDFWNGLRETEREKLRYAFGQAAAYNLANGDLTNASTEFGMGIADDMLGFGAKADGTGTITGADDILKAALVGGQDKIKDMDFAGHTIETQEDAQQALNALNDAIVTKDKTRAHLGALQNRLENTVSNLTTQSENLQAAESRISDVDVATEMTNFVRNQILTQSAVAMLSQANSMPQMAMQLIH